MHRWILLHVAHLISFVTAVSYIILLLKGTSFLLMTRSDSDITLATPPVTNQAALRISTGTVGQCMHTKLHARTLLSAALQSQLASRGPRCVHEGAQVRATIEAVQLRD